MHDESDLLEMVEREFLGFVSPTAPASWQAAIRGKTTIGRPPA
jgi:hypothetical protein